MTLRVTLEIVPFGEESRKYVIETIDISNIESIAFGRCKYKVDHKGHKQTEVEHNRQEGALALVQKAVSALVNGLYYK